MAAGAVIDKHGRLAALVPGAGASMELGCGGTRTYRDAVTVDAIDAESVDVVGDVFDVLAKVPEGAIATMYSSHFLEHVADLRRLLGEFQRVVAIGGRLVATAPHFSNPYYYSDPTHVRPFGLYSFSYFAKDELFRRRVPSYQSESSFRLADARLIFKAPRPFYPQHLLGIGLTALVNSTRLTQEWYEGFWCWLVPCYEVRFVLVREA